MRSKEDTDNSRRVFQSASASGRYKYDMNAKMSGLWYSYEIYLRRNV